MTTSFYANSGPEMAATLHVALIVMSSDGIVISWDDVAARLFGRSASDAIGRKLSEIIGLPEQAAQDLDVFDQIHHEIDQPRRIRLARGDGSVFLADVSSTPIPGKDSSSPGLVLSVHDAGALNAVEGELRRTRDRYRSLVETLPAAIYTHIMEPNFSGTNYISPQIEQISGYAPERWQSDQRFHRRIIHPDDLQRVTEIFETHRISMEPISVEYRYVRPDGTTVWVRNDAVFRASDEPHWQGIIVDITPQKRAEETLRRSEDEFRRSFVDAAIPMAVARSDGFLVRVNVPFCTMMGYLESELIGTDISLLTHPDDRDDSARQRRNVIESDVHSAKYSRRYLRRDGSVAWGIVNLSSTRSLGDQSVYVLGQIQDVTEQKLAEEALAKSETRFRRLVEKSNDVVSILDTDGIILYQSPSAEAIVGYTYDEVVGTSILYFVHPADIDRVKQALEELEHDPSKTIRIEFRIRDRSGNLRWVESTARNLLDDPSVGGVVLNSRGVTDRHRTNDSLAMQNEALRLLIDGQPLPEILQTICYAIDRQIERGSAAILIEHPDNGEKTLAVSPGLDGLTQFLDTHGVSVDEIVGANEQNDNR